MKPALVFIALVAVAVGVWYLRGNSDSSLLNAKDAQIAAMTETLQTKEKLRVQDETLLDTRDTSIKTLQDKIKSDEDLLAKNQAQLEVDKAEYQRLQTADQTIITSLKSDNNADIQVLKEQIQAKDDQIAQLNEKLVQTIANYENQLNAPRTAPGSQPASVAEDGKKIYPADDGFDLQSLGSGMFAYQVFSQLHNPNNAPQPPSIANRTPWTFGGTGNSGITPTRRSMPQMRRMGIMMARQVRQARPPSFNSKAVGSARRSSCPPALTASASITKHVVTTEMPMESPSHSTEPISSLARLPTRAISRT